MINVQHWFYPQMFFFVWFGWWTWSSIQTFRRRHETALKFVNEQDPYAFGLLPDSMKQHAAYVAYTFILLTRQGLLLWLLFFGGFFA